MGSREVLWDVLVAYINENSSDEDFIGEPDTEYTVGGSPLTLEKTTNFHVSAAILDSGDHGNLEKCQI